jgi:hypothetical protein
MITIYRCEKCQIEFDSSLDCSIHEKICGKQICSNYCEYLIKKLIEVNGEKGCNYDCLQKQDVSKHYDKNNCEYYYLEENRL